MPKRAELMIVTAMISMWARMIFREILGISSPKYLIVHWAQNVITERRRHEKNISELVPLYEHWVVRTKQYMPIPRLACTHKQTHTHKHTNQTALRPTDSNVAIVLVAVVAVDNFDPYCWFLGLWLCGHCNWWQPNGWHMNNIHIQHRPNLPVKGDDDTLIYWATIHFLELLYRFYVTIIYNAVWFLWFRLRRNSTDGTNFLTVAEICERNYWTKWHFENVCNV